MLVRRIGLGASAAVAGVALHRAYATCAYADSAPPQALFSLNGKTALVTGASQGLGKAIARGLALAGADVIISSRREDLLKAALVEITAGTNIKASYIVADLSQPSEAERLGHAALELAAGGVVDVLVNNAGVSIPGSIHKGEAVKESAPPMTAEDYDIGMQTNLHSVVQLTNTLMPAMVSKGRGRVINITSIGGLGSSEGRTMYTASKAGLIGITWTGALECGPHGVTVNAIAPGPFLTEMPLKNLSKATLEAIGGKVPLRRWADPSEMVGPVVFLASDAGSFVNGVTLTVDGGLMARAY